jgi:hypothetical protein
VHQKFAEALPTGHSTMHMYPINGAVHRVGKSDTAFAYRDVLLAGVIVGVDPDPKDKEKITEWTKSYYDVLHPHSAGGAYVNFMMEEGQDRVKALPPRLSARGVTGRRRRVYFQSAGLRAKNRRKPNLKTNQKEHDLFHERTDWCGI